MKSKVKLNPGGLKELAIQHGEKAVFGLGVLALVMFLWSASKTEVLGPDKQSEQLKASANLADAHITSSKWDPKAKGIEVVDYVSRAKRDPLNDKDYRHLVYPDKPLWETKGKRPDPKILPVEELYASAGSGIFALSSEDQQMGGRGGPAGGPSAGPRRVGPGGMPMGGPGGPGGPRAGRKPAEAEPAPPPRRRRVARRDEPEAKGVRVSARSNLKGYCWAVVTGVVPVRKQELEFEEAFQNVILNVEEADLPEYLGWRIQRAEVTSADPDKIDWKDTDLPLKTLFAFKDQWQIEAKEVIDENNIDPLFTMPLAPLVGEDWDPKVVGHPKIPLAVKKTQEVRKKDEVDPDDENEVVGWNVRRRVNDNFGEPPMGDRRRGNRAGGGPARHADQTLFRIIDNTVEAGKHYRYRVQLRMTNPNAGIAEKYLKDPASRAKKVVYSAWSEPTAMITVPGSIDVLVGSVARASKEPTISVAIKRLDFENGRILKTQADFGRGQVLNIHKDELVLEGEERIVVKNAVLNSNAVVVDIEGGKPFRSGKSPVNSLGEMVILYPDGRLEVRDERGDQSAYRTLLPSEPEEAAEELLPNNPYDKQKPKKSRREQMKEDNKQKKAKKGA